MLCIYVTNIKFMKRKPFILLVTILFISFAGYAQTVNDSAGTRNDKPGTPQSLRIADQSPQSHVTIINGNGAAVNNTNGQTKITTTTNAGGNEVPTTPITLKTTPVKRADTIQKVPLGIKVSNVSNPIRN